MNPYKDGGIMYNTFLSCNMMKHKPSCLKHIDPLIGVEKY